MRQHLRESAVVFRECSGRRGPAGRPLTAFSPAHSVNATMELMPMPEARANGRFAIKPMASVMMAAPMHVAVKAALNGMPAETRICGFTAMM